MPAEIADRFTAIPVALWQHGPGLGLGAHELALIPAMWSHKWYADAPIKAGRKRLAAMTGLSEKSVQRSINGLVERGLLRVMRAGDTKHAPVADYDLSPLWEALAAVERDTRPVLTVVEGGHPDRQGGQADHQGGHADHRGVVTLTTEVDVVEVDEGEVEERSRPPAREASSSSRSLADELRAKAADPDTFPSTAAKLMAHARAEEAREAGVPLTLSAREESTQVMAALRRLENATDDEVAAMQIGGGLP